MQRLARTLRGGRRRSGGDVRHVLVPPYLFAIVLTVATLPYVLTPRVNEPLTVIRSARAMFGFIHPARACAADLRLPRDITCATVAQRSDPEL